MYSWDIFSHTKIPWCSLMNFDLDDILHIILFFFTLILILLAITKGMVV